MSILATYSLLFLGSSFVGVGLLSWFQKFYLQGQPDQYLKSVPITAGVTFGLCFVIIMIMIRLLRPIDKIIKRVEAGEEPTDQDREIVLKSTKKMNKVTIISTVIGFVFGNLTTVMIAVMLGRIPFQPEKILFAIIHSIGFGGIATLYTINLMDLFMNSKRKLMKIHSLDQNQLSGTMSSSLTYMFVVSVLATTSTVGMVPFHLINNKNTEMFGSGINFYLTNMILVAVITFILTIIPFFLIVKGLSKRLKENSEAVKDIAKSGNLINRLDIVVNDDFGILTGSVNELMDKLSGMVSGIRTQTQNVSVSANDISDATNSSVSALTQMQSSLDKISSEGNEQHQIINDISKDIDGLKDGAEELTEYMISQSSAMQQNSASIAEMAANIKNVAEMTRKADYLTTSLAQISEKGNDLVTSSITAISDIQQASIEVQKIIKVIQAIASQTNLLSMNAAIEAAHAGEFGAGFAVVANEVRSLAANSSRSAKDIQSHIKDMVAKISVGVSTSQQAGQAFKDIADSVAENQKIMQQLSSAMEEQRVGAEENMRVTNSVSDALEKANSLAQKQSEFAERVKTTMDNVVSLTDDISRYIDEGLNATQNMQESINKVENSVSTNRSAVDAMESEVSSFQV